MKTVAIFNSKGGAGKTTLATNLAAYYASLGKVTVLKDFDPQCSSTDWLEIRPNTADKIHGIAAGKQSMHATRAWQMRLPQNTDYVIVDSPAGVNLNAMLTTLRGVDKVLVPVLPSPIDLRASAIFINQLQKFLKMYNCNTQIGVIASRVARRGPSYFSLQRVFTNLDLALIATIEESECYIRAAEKGLSIHDMNSALAKNCQKDWISIFDWVDGNRPESQGTALNRAVDMRETGSLIL